MPPDHPYTGGNMLPQTCNPLHRFDRPMPVASVPARPPDPSDPSDVWALAATCGASPSAVRTIDGWQARAPHPRYRRRLPRLRETMPDPGASGVTTRILTPAGTVAVTTARVPRSSDPAHASMVERVLSLPTRKGGRVPGLYAAGVPMPKHADDRARLEFLRLYRDATPDGAGEGLPGPWGPALARWVRHPLTRDILRLEATLRQRAKRAREQEEARRADMYPRDERRDAVLAEASELRAHAARQARVSDPITWRDLPRNGRIGRALAVAGMDGRPL